VKQAFGPPQLRYSIFRLFVENRLSGTYRLAVAGRVNVMARFDAGF
jgi:hypothetical protein